MPITCVVYQATVTREDNQEQQTYIGITEGTFKTGFNNHTSSFRKSKNRNSTALSKYVWTLKDSNVNFNIAWKIIRRCITKKCNLCLHEKFIIIYYPHLGTLKSRIFFFISGIEFFQAIYYKTFPVFFDIFVVLTRCLLKFIHCMKLQRLVIRARNLDLTLYSRPKLFTKR